MRRSLTLMMAGALLAAAPALAQAPASSGPALTAPAAARTLRDAQRYPLFAAEVARARASVDEAIRAGVNVPVPKDPGGGFTHEQHKRNYRAIHNAGLLFRITGERRYADFARDLLLAYADLYPTLGRHPAARNEVPGRLFWQSLNDAVWVVNSVQGYDAIRGSLTPEQRRTIDERVFRKAATFLSDESPQNFARIHNHATWSVAAVGMTGYVLRDRDMVEKALLGIDRSGRSGFLRQLDLLFSPEGYYEEGPYYQRYALMPFVVFAKAIEANEPGRRIFQHRGGVLPKAIRTTIQLSYNGFFFPLNDALKDKGLDTEELHHGVAIAYGLTGDPALLSTAQRQGRTVLTPDGARVAQGLSEKRQRAFPFSSLLLGDGPDGERGALAILRAGPGDTGQALVAKNTAQGMGHGHFDKLHWLFFDNGEEIVTDYGAARFLNIEAKSGGVYLPENNSWAKQTVAHNTLVVNEASHFNAKLSPAEKAWPTQVFFQAGPQTQISAARMDGAYPGVSFTRTLTLLKHAEFPHGLVVDLLKVDGPAPAQYDLPLHYRGHIMRTGFKLDRNLEARPVLGKANGYQHLWVDGAARPSADEAFMTWLHKGRFYTYRFLPPAEGAQVLAVELGANDPQFNLRREPALIQRVSGLADTTFVSLLEPHGEYNAAAEFTVGADSRVRRLQRVASASTELVLIDTVGGKRIALAVSGDPDPAKTHRITFEGRTFEWKGFHARFDD